MARLDICLASKIINNELCYDVTKDGFFSITLPEKNVKYCSNCIYFENICFYIQNRAKMPNSSYTIYNAYNTYVLRTIRTIHTIHTIHTIRTIHTIHAIHTIHTIRTIHTIHNFQTKYHAYNT
jgi:hypothetical protein